MHRPKGQPRAAAVIVVLVIVSFAFSLGGCRAADTDSSVESTQTPVVDSKPLARTELRENEVTTAETSDVDGQSKAANDSTAENSQSDMPAGSSTATGQSAATPVEHGSTSQGEGTGTEATDISNSPSATYTAEPPVVSETPVTPASSTASSTPTVPNTLISATGSSINVRALPQHKSALVTTVEWNTAMQSTGEVAQGYGSDGQLHNWYRVSVPNVGEGWVRSDLVMSAPQQAMESTNQATRLTSGTGDALNLRSDPQHESALVVQVSADAILLFYGQMGEGYGSDGQLHTWYYVEAPDYGAWGWVRSDLTQAL